MPVSFSELQCAFEFVSSGGMGENEAYLDRQSGKIYWHSEFGDNDKELPDDIDDEKYTAIPDKRELDLGKPLVLDFALSFYPRTTTKFAVSSAEEALTADLRICWCGGAPLKAGTIFRTRPRKRLCGSGVWRTGSTSVGPEVTLLHSTGGLAESAGFAGSRPSPCSVVR
jgi:hypothetical protein